MPQGADMDKKYIGKTVMLPKEAARLLDEYKKRLEKELGFDVSYSQAIAHALKKASEK
jgi:hypothetical protein